MSSASGWRVVVTGSSTDRFRPMLEALGATVIGVQTIEIRSLVSEPMDQALNRLERYDWCVVTSANGVRAVFDRIGALKARVPADLRWAAVGPRTRSALADVGVTVDAVPREGRGAAIPDVMNGIDGQRVLLLRAGKAGSDLPQMLRARGAKVDDVVAYETIEGPSESRPAAAQAFREPVDAIVFTSGSSVRGLLRLAAREVAHSSGVAVCIGPVTAGVALECGFTAIEVADEPTPEGVATAIERAARRRDGHG